MDNAKKLQDIFNDDSLGILDVKVSSSGTRTENERLTTSFQEISDFYEHYQREPAVNLGVREAELFFRLKGIRENSGKKSILAAQDTHGLLLKTPEKEIKTIDDIFSNDFMGILDSDAESIFTLKNVPRHDARESADFVANRKPAKNFKEYESIFAGVQNDLKTGRRKLISFSEFNLKEGNFYVHNGILLYLEKANLEISAQKYKSGQRTRKDGRTHCIFENGTESNMLYRSLYKALLDNGKTVSNTQEEIAEEYSKKVKSITDEDREDGYIYVLRSKTKDPKIACIANLYKIGFSKTPVEDRIKNAAQEPTYLMAPVSIVTTFKCFNMNPQKLELLLHTFFGSSCLNIDVFDSEKNRHTPREWFIAPLTVIEQAIELILSGEIVNCKYHAQLQTIVSRKNS